jgi:hypothetical protein
MARDAAWTDVDVVVVDVVVGWSLSQRRSS